ncbi:antitoxin ParD1/3/4 [Bryocella elongata]|uniref:Antitoxin ParD1/3/4 n=2 Tax=Bryocella elongata TaxID=863522 RepID=A0A1H6C1G7_9BACT|nr:antitoxin ParD1/3/4 [Bryocella elongata]
MASTINITLPESLSKFVEAQVEAGAFGTPGQYIRELIQEDRERRVRKLEDHLLSALHDDEGFIEIPEDVLESGDVTPFLESSLHQPK